ncbi:hypothetical protein CAEBREN_19873 [Caenorhabditis brenneri]|uniref:Uncharacterized protein n=1 Tax=Caenorhabditis brenneri TaxID=135651 RepID=G0MQH3_CAEBE|nr:hypothetical protein CAEBREN_19873 [Caenorhabditis brenneri]
MTDDLEARFHQLAHPYLTQQLDPLQQLHPELQAQVQAQIQLQSQLQIQKQVQEQIQLDFQARIQAQLQSQPENLQHESQTQGIPLPPAPSLSPLSSLAQFGQVPQYKMANAPFDPVLEVPFNVPPPQQQAQLPVIPMGFMNTYMDLLNAQLPLINQLYNPLIGLSPLAYTPLQSKPVPLMSLRIPTPPNYRSHPYQRERVNEMLRRTRQRNDSLHSINGKEGNSPQNHRSYALPPRSEMERLGEALRREAELSEKEDSWRRRR